MTGNPTALTLEDPLDLDDARRAAHVLAVQRREAEKTLERAVEDAARKEELYRLALSRAFVQAEGQTAAQREANARSVAAKDGYERDLSAGMVKVAQERLKGLEGERAMLRALIEWSQKILEVPS